MLRFSLLLGWQAKAPAPKALRTTLLCLLLSWSATAQVGQPASQNEYTRHLLIDWAGLTRYGSENAEIRPAKPGEDRVVFLGDQITEQWAAGDGRFFPGKPYLNRGIRNHAGIINDGGIGFLL